VEQSLSQLVTVPMVVLDQVLQQQHKVQKDQIQYLVLHQAQEYLLL
jgi:3-oxoacyl-[acyl-carrier-protein] synthase III